LKSQELGEPWLFLVVRSVLFSQPIPTLARETLVDSADGPLVKVSPPFTKLQSVLTKGGFTTGWVIRPKA
jgi:hypothetical protein